ncbi:homeobox-leucine zipper protein HDG2 isoform X1 [Brassica napus]|uniref:homeobox-leucine zipper protein HDG2 isoform X1 n=2 Tax=Brassica napus TaxID=3708 RepID=UPI00207A27B9|nr:homeobox-leucine zipper protein HDG2 isoform X1 [Brassica napus]XP_048613731.1 homeobox-leucine zipper protein HDG2 isoform X1 [Brassica napus]
MSEDNTRKKVKGLAFNFKFKKKMFEPNMFLAAMNNEDSNNHNYNHEDNNNNNERFLRDEEFDSANTKSGSENQEGGSGNDQDNHHPNKKKRYHRHTQLQIQEMEAFFKECPHPDDKQRKQLSRELGLEPLQVKFWFQNKRTQMKNHHERHENSHLRAENEKLRGDNIRYREALANASCPNCGGPTVIGEMSFDEHQLRLENARLREEIDRISAIAAKYVGKPVSSYPLMSPPPLPPRPLELAMGNFGGDVYGNNPTDLFKSITAPTESDKPLIIDLAVAAMEELMRMTQVDEPLWKSLVVDEEEYARTFPRGIGPKPAGFRTEASRESVVVIMNHVNIVEILMDVNQWSVVFAGMVSRAVSLAVLSTGVAGNYNGALQVMSAEFQVPTPLVPTRETYFARYCKQQADGSWAVVDISLDSLQPNPPVRCRRRASGCLIQEMPNGYSKVTWVEHVEVDDRGGVHDLYKHMVSTGHAFGAKRWVAILDRQCERLASVMATNISPGEVGGINIILFVLHKYFLRIIVLILIKCAVITNQEGRRSMLKLAERMVISFCAGVSASTAHTWTTLSGTGAEDVRVMTRKSVDDPGRPPGIVLSAATSFWIPVPPKRVFDFLRDENSRNEWDILSNGGVVQEMAHIANGRDTGNCVSLLRVNSANSSQSNMLILQESCTDPTASFVIYAPVDIVAMNIVLNGGDPDYVALLPSGFAILPDGNANGGGEGGSLLTVAFQILVDSVPTAKLSLGSVATVNNLIACTVERIKAAMSCETA